VSSSRPAGVQVDLRLRGGHDGNHPIPTDLDARVEGPAGRPHSFSSAGCSARSPTPSWNGRRPVLRADVAELQGPDYTVGDLVDEQQIQQAQRCPRRQVGLGRQEHPVELIARKTDNQNVDGADLDCGAPLVRWGEFSEVKW
jgi:hypothetical protein